MGVIATHEEYPIERLALDRNKKWLGSVSHDECIKLTDVENIFEDAEDDESENGAEASGDAEDDVEMGAEKGDVEDDDDEGSEDEDEDEDEEMEEDSDSDAAPRTKKPKKNPMGDMGRSAREDDSRGFFDDL